MPAWLNPLRRLLRRTPSRPFRRASVRLRMEPLEDRTNPATLDEAHVQIAYSLGAVKGVTVVVHGWSYLADGDYMLPMAQAIVNRSGGRIVNHHLPRYEGSDSFTVSSRTAGSDSFDNDQIVVVFDWDPATFHRGTGWGEAGGCTAPLGLGAKSGLESGGFVDQHHPWKTEDGPPAPSFGFPSWG